MNWQPPPVTRCKYFHVRSDAASMRHTVTGGGRQLMSLIVSGTAVKKYLKNGRHIKASPSYAYGHGMIIKGVYV